MAGRQGVVLRMTNPNADGMLNGWTIIAKILVITSLKIEKGLALQDLIAGAYEFLDTVELPKQSRIYLLDHLGSTE